MAALVLSSTVAACSGDDRPAPSDTLGSRVAESSTPAADDEPTEPGAVKPRCEPRSYRDCKVYYRDESGQLQCPTLVQICAADGSAWLACGKFSYDENGDPVPIAD